MAALDVPGINDFDPCAERARAIGARMQARLADSLRYIRANEVFARTIATALLHSTLAMGFIHMLPVFAKDVLQVDSRGLGILAAAAGIGVVFYRGSRRVNLGAFFRWTGHIAPGDAMQLAAHIDLLPTLAELARRRREQFLRAHEHADGPLHFSGRLRLAHEVVVHAHRRRRRLRDPVHHEVRQQRVLAESALDVAVAVAPRAELLDDPRREPDRRIVERGGQRLRLRHLQARVRDLGLDRRTRVDELLLRGRERRRGTGGADDRRANAECSGCRPVLRSQMVPDRRGRG